MGINNFHPMTLLWADLPIALCLAIPQRHMTGLPSPDYSLPLTCRQHYAGILPGLCRCLILTLPSILTPEHRFSDMRVAVLLSLLVATSGEYSAISFNSIPRWPYFWPSEFPFLVNHSYENSVLCYCHRHHQTLFSDGESSWSPRFMFPEINIW